MSAVVTISVVEPEAKGCARCAKGASWCKIHRRMRQDEYREEQRNKKMDQERYFVENRDIIDSRYDNLAEKDDKAGDSKKM